MKRLTFLFLAVLMSGCGPSASDLTASADAARAPTQTALPTSTLTPIPTITPSPTITPTPLGGRSGIFYYSVGPYGNQPDGADTSPYGIWQGNTAGGDLRLLVDYDQLVESLGPFEWLNLFSFGPTWVLVTYDQSRTFTYYPVGEDWQVGEKWPFGGRHLSSISPDGSKAIIYDSELRNLWVVNLDGSGERLLGRGASSWWSADGSHIYFDEFGYMALANADGTNVRRLEMLFLDNYDPYEGVPLPAGMVSRGGHSNALDGYSPSPDSSRIAIAWYNVIFLADPADLEFQSPEFLLEIPFLEGYEPPYNHIINWSPDGAKMYVAYLMRQVDGNTTLWGIIVVDIETASIEGDLTTATSVYSPCGFTPDDRAIVYVEGESLYLVSLDGEVLQEVVMGQGRVSCPIWP